MALAISPTYLKYRQRGRAIIVIMASSAAPQITLLVLLIPALGAAGAAAAYAVATCCRYSAFAILGRRELKRVVPRVIAGT